MHENHLVPSFRRLITFLTKDGIDALDMTQLKPQALLSSQLAVA